MGAVTLLIFRLQYCAFGILLPFDLNLATYYYQVYDTLSCLVLKNRLLRDNQYQQQTHFQSIGGCDNEVLQVFDILF